jgi:peptidoglycan/LPS O-acetylase OafA/YrhL
MMTQRSSCRPEYGVLLAVLLLGADVLLVVLLLLGTISLSHWYGIALLAVIAGTALLILAYSRKRRREQRPEWLETHAWQKGLIDKLHEKATPPRDQEAAAEKRSEE